MVYFFILVGLCLFGKVLLCDPSEKRTECGSSNSCPSTCCSDLSTILNCYFNEKDYGPIRHSSGLCLNVKNGSHSDNTPLIWSRDCTSRNAFFLVPHDLPPYHVASGKCVLPKGYLGDPGRSADLFLKSDRYCKGRIARYQPTANGNLMYLYVNTKYGLCIGSKSVRVGKWEPSENERVSIEEDVCNVNNSCKLHYVYERKFLEGEVANFQCESCSASIKVIWADYGEQLRQRYPFAISKKDQNCQATDPISVIQNKCDGKTSCSFIVRDADFLSSKSNCESNYTTLLVRYTCDWIPAAPTVLSVQIRSQHELRIVLLNDDHKFQLCRKKDGEMLFRCNSYSSVGTTLKWYFYGLQSASKYIINVARYTKDGNTLGKKTQIVVVTRSAALQATGTKSSSFFEIKLRKLQSDDIYIQILVSKLQNNTKPIRYPGNDLQPYDDQNATYIAAELDKTDVNETSVFTVGDGKKYGRSKIEFENVKLKSGAYYSVIQRTFKSAELYYDSDWMDVIQTNKLSQADTSSTSSISTTLSEMRNYGPIRHSSGLCLNVKDGSHGDNIPLIWSRDCTSRNAFFLVPHDLPPYHVASGKCALPKENVGNPGKSAVLFLKSNNYCREHVVRYQPTANGNLMYLYLDTKYYLCIGSKSVRAGKWEPSENERVSIEEDVCYVNNSCKLDYVYQRKFSEGEYSNFQCESCSLGIEVIWADYGVQLKQRFPFAIAKNDPNCRTTRTTSVMQNKCNGKTSCYFRVRDTDFLPSKSNCGSNRLLIVRYTCKKIPAAPKFLNVEVISQNELKAIWSNDNNNGGQICFELCWIKDGKAFVLCRVVCDSRPTISARITRLQSATKYIISVAQHSTDGKIIGKKRQKAAITRSDGLRVLTNMSSGDIIAKEGDLVNLLCSAQGEPPITFSWEKDQTSLENFVETEKPYRSSFLVVTLKDQTSFGKYICHIRDRFHIITHTIVVRKDPCASRYND